MKLTALAITLTILFSTNAMSSTEIDELLRLDEVSAFRPIVPIPEDHEVITVIGEPTKKQLPARKFKFLVWNIFKGAKESFKKEYLALSFDRDIVINQEVYLDQNMNAVLKYLPHFSYTTATSFFAGKDKIRTGLANASNVVTTSKEFIRTETLEPVLKSPKLALITTYPIRFSTKSLTVVNIHGVNFVSNKSYRRELARIYEKIKNVTGPLVFAGDFNTWNQERIDILDEFAQKLGLAYAQFLPDNRITFNGFPLDHFLHSKDLKITKGKVEDHFEGSDHKPLMVEVEYISR